MKKLEYLCPIIEQNSEKKWDLEVTGRFHSEFDTMEEAMNYLGADGWELVSLDRRVASLSDDENQPALYSWEMYFKRETP